METEEEKAMRLADEKRVMEIYGCDDHPIAYMIEPRGEIKMVREGQKPDPKDFETIL